MATRAVKSVAILICMPQPPLLHFRHFDTLPATADSPSPPPPFETGNFPKDTLKLGVCADLLHLVVGTPAKTPCCGLISGLADLEAALCLCTAIKADILGIDINIPVSLEPVAQFLREEGPIRLPIRLRI